MTLPREIQRGFTLVELMVAIAIVGIVSVVIYQLFDVTSTNFREVDQLADTNDRLRFALERVRTDVQAAGAQGSPDSLNDSWVRPKPAGTVRISGLVPYDGWQDDRSMMDAAVAARNPNVSFDGIVVVGAYDFPLAFELAGLEENGGAREGVVEAHYKGLWRLLTQDPFMKGLQNFPAVTAAHLQGLGQGTNWTTRLVRTTDRQGFMQFMAPESIDGPFPGTDFDFITMQFPPDNSDFGPKFKSTADGAFGLDDLNEGDIAYESALLDAFWIHALPDPSNPKVLNLVRDRLCAMDVAADGFSASWDPSSALASQCPGNPGNERTIIASNLADFQIWFDCADPVTGGVQGATWGYEWTAPTNVGECMDPAVGDPGAVRSAHVRLSIHTKSERKDRPHIQFEDNTGFVCDPDNPGACGAFDANMLRTYDFYPDSRGSARVVVMQSDFEVVNFVNHNL